MDIFDLLDNLEKISYENKTDCPRIYIQIGDIQVPLLGVHYYPETDVYCETIILSDGEVPTKMIL